MRVLSPLVLAVYLSACLVPLSGSLCLRHCCEQLFSVSERPCCVAHERVGCGDPACCGAAQQAPDPADLICDLRATDLEDQHLLGGQAPLQAVPAPVPWSQTALFAAILAAPVTARHHGRCFVEPDRARLARRQALAPVQLLL